MAESRFAKEIQTLTLQKAELRDVKAKLDASGMQTKLAVTVRSPGWKRSGINAVN